MTVYNKGKNVKRYKNLDLLVQMVDNHIIDI